MILYLKYICINKKVIYCRDLVTLTSHDPKNPTLDKKKFFQYFCSSHKGLSACQKSKWYLHGFSRYFLIRKKLTKKLAKKDLFENIDKVAKIFIA